ncbi:serine hydroxymethyltransferase [Candidatus Peregrinibacteria bacterium]|nr:MAG: serine hydroxymethyltransferase [Candidatus Peregrinibacteria bacterium]
MLPHLQAQDPAIYSAIMAESKRQAEELELIASENYVSPAVLEAMGTILTNKYSEGYVGKRYYAGQVNIDTVETLAIERAKQLFGCDHVNVQPLSGSPANAAVYFATIKPGDKVLGLSLDHGGHLSHGHPVNFSGMLYDFVRYGVEENGYIDMDKVEEIALREKPKMIVAGFSAYSRNMDWKRFKEIADKIGAITFADIAHIAGLIAGQQLENPVPYFDIVSTTTHKTLRGPRGAMIMCKEAYAKAIDKAVFPGMQGGPHDHINAAKAVAFAEALKPEFKEYSRQVIANAKVLASELMAKGFKIVSGGTDNHLMLIDTMASKGAPGKDAEKALELAGISCNKNMVPFDTRSPFDPSGIRIGTPALTTRGMKENEMRILAGWIDEVVSTPTDAAIQAKVLGEVKELCKGFPVPGIEA